MEASLLQGQSCNEKAGLRTASSMFFSSLRGRRNRSWLGLRKQRSNRKREQELEEIEDGTGEEEEGRDSGVRHSSLH